MKAVWNGVTIAESDETIVVEGTKATVRPEGTPESTGVTSSARRRSSAYEASDTAPLDSGRRESASSGARGRAAAHYYPPSVDLARPRSQALESWWRSGRPRSNGG